MTTIHPETLLGDIVTANPSSVAIFTKFNLDFCCHGQRPLAQACTEAGIDLQEVLNALQATSHQETQRADWADLDDSLLAAHIVNTHHQYLWTQFPSLAELVDKVAKVHGPTHPELAQVRDAFHALRQGIEPHLRREETWIFPQISLHAATPQEPISQELREALEQNQQEHDEAGELLATMRRLTQGYIIPEGACKSYTAMLQGLQALEEDLHIHVHKENNVLFARTLARS